MNLISCCPLCGGKSGYNFRAIEIQDWTGSWENGNADVGKEEFVDSIKFTTNKIIICKDCDKKIKRSFIEI